MHSFKNDYTELAHPQIMQAMLAANLEQDHCYGLDKHSETARQLIGKQLGGYAEKADIHFLCGGTQANLTALSAFLRPHEAIIAPETAHICVHESGAIEATGHKIIACPAGRGKIEPQAIQAAVAAHTDEHMVKPRLVKISQSTELGTVYSKLELTAISRVCREHDLLLYIDGARLGAALTAAGNDLALPDICGLADAFYIGGTKNGALLGEALVIVNDRLKPEFRWHIKQKGGLLAKGRLLGIQFEELFRDNLFFELAARANRLAGQLVAGIGAAGFSFLVDSPTNQIFPILPKPLIAALEKDWDFYVWQELDRDRAALRLVTSWATPQEAVQEFIAAINKPGA